MDKTNKFLLGCGFALTIFAGLCIYRGLGPLGSTLSSVRFSSETTGYVREARLAEDENDDRKAEILYNKAVASDNNDEHHKVKAYAGLGRLKSRTGNPTEAAEYYFLAYSSARIMGLKRDEIIAAEWAMHEYIRGGNYGHIHGTMKTFMDDARMDGCYALLQKLDYVKSRLDALEKIQETVPGANLDPNSWGIVVPRANLGPNSGRATT